MCYSSLCFEVRLGNQMVQLTKMYFTSPESCVYGAVTHVSSMLTAAALTWQSAFDEVD